MILGRSLCRISDIARRQKSLDRVLQGLSGARLPPLEKAHRVRQNPVDVNWVDELREYLFGLVTLVYSEQHLLALVRHVDYFIWVVMYVVHVPQRRAAVC